MCRMGSRSCFLHNLQVSKWSIFSRGCYQNNIGSHSYPISYLMRRLHLPDMDRSLIPVRKRDPTWTNPPPNNDSWDVNYKGEGVRSLTRNVWKRYGGFPCWPSTTVIRSRRCEILEKFTWKDLWNEDGEVQVCGLQFLVHGISDDDHDEDKDQEYMNQAMKKICPVATTRPWWTQNGTRP